MAYCLFPNFLGTYFTSQALTSGSITGFIDILLNMNKSQRFTLDNIVYQLKEAGKRLIFYGDDTWLKLFPGSFQRHDGTTSFFVNDYTEVCKLRYFKIIYTKAFFFIIKKCFTGK